MSTSTEQQLSDIHIAIEQLKLNLEQAHVDQSQLAISLGTVEMHYMSLTKRIEILEAINQHTRDHTIPDRDLTADLEQVKPDDSGSPQES